MNTPKCAASAVLWGVVALATAASAQTYPLRDFPDTLYLKCNEGTGATLNSEAFPGAGPGTFTFTTPGASTWVLPGQLGAAAVNISATTGGTGQAIASGAAPNYGGSFTIELWVNPQGALQNGLLGDATAGGLTIAWPSGVTVPGQLQWRGGGTTATNEYVTFTHNSVTGTWSHIACVQDTTIGQRRVLVNGALAGTATFNPPTAGYPGAIGLTFGVNGTGTDWAFDDIRVWNKLRTNAEILANYLAELNARNKLTLSQSGPLVGDLTVTLASASTTADNGWTLVSADISGAGSTGPVFGIRPDFLSWQILLNYPQAPHNVFHFPVPGGGFFPDIPFAVGPGSVSSLAGTTLDVVCVLTLSGAINSASNVVRFPFN